jgi:dGTPase
VDRSRGRRYPELAHKFRNHFQRDRDRIVHARAFRRLENKTQVFTPGISDHFRNRLTHTLEVAQIARTVAAYLGLDEDLTEALALVHDIGHPPFGHAGERELDRQMRVFGDRFDHNLHALHMVESFEHRYAMFPGLNLTFEVREGIVKHSRDLEPGKEPAELEEYLPELRPPLEAQLIDLADEIAYNTADLDDAQSAGMVDLDELSQRVPHFGRVRETIGSQYPGAPERIQFLECVRRLIDVLVSSLIEGTVTTAREAKVSDVEEVRQYPMRLVCLIGEAQVLNRDLKSFLHQRVYAHPDLHQGRERSTAAVAQMFRFYLQHPDRLPRHYQDETEGRPLHRTVCNYIAGMTDWFFWKVHHELFPPAIESPAE